MAKNTTGPTGGNGRARKTTGNLNNHITTKEIVSYPPPPSGCDWISPEGETRARDLINRAIVLGAVPDGWTLEVQGFDVADDGREVVHFDLVVPASTFNLDPGLRIVYQVGTFGWRPTVELDAINLRERADAAWQTGVAIDDARTEAQEGTDFSRDDQAARRILAQLDGAERTLDEHCVTLMDAALDLSRWTSLIPDDVGIVGFFSIVKPRQGEGRNTK